MSGSGGRGGTFVNRSPEQLRGIVRKAEDETTIAAFEAELAEMLSSLLSEVNSRDVNTVRARLDNLKVLLEKGTEGTIDQLFGGSVAKHTYVDGLSDIDSIVFIDETDLEGAGPRTVLERMQNIIQKNLKEEAQVSHGRMAVTVAYPDGMQIQLLPALKLPGHQIAIPSSRREDWSRIDPIAFQRALTTRNDECAGKLIPTIKLAKAINGQLPEVQRLSGYHIESLGIAAFEKYEGKKTTPAMLPYFFERARELVLSPIRDSTGQSVHVDEYLGSANSEARQTASHILERIARRMRNASAASSTALWQALFGLEE